MMTNKRLLSGYSILLLAAALFLAAACKNSSGLTESQVVSVTIDPVTAELSRGDSRVFTAAVEVLGGASAEVTWEVTGKDDAGADTKLHPDTRVIFDEDETDTATLYVGADEPAAVLRVTVRSVEDTTQNDTAVVTLNSGSYVSGVTITEGDAINLNQGKTCTLHAEVEGPGLTEEDKALTWTIESVHTEGTSINAGGTLTIAVDEPLGDLTVRAASVKDPAKFAEISVTILDEKAPAVTSVIVSAEGGVTRAGPGGTLIFTANVTVENGASTGVTWTLTGNAKTATTLVENPNNKATLTVATDETAATLTITAASTAEGFTNTKNSVTVSVSKGDIYLIGTDFGGWPETPVATSGLAADSKADNIFTWNKVFMTANNTFKFHDDTVNNSWNSGTWYVAKGNNVEPVGSLPVETVAQSGINNSWKTAATGKYTIVLNITSETVKFTPIPEVTAVTAITGPDSVKLGGTGEFTAVVTATHGATVTWSLSGGKEGTTLVQKEAEGNTATLTVAPDETADTLTIKAQSSTDPSQFKEKTVTVAAAADSTVYLIGAAILDGESEWPAAPGTAADKAMTKEAEGKWTWTGMMRGDKTFKFHDDTVTGWKNGTWYEAEGTDVSTAGTEPKTVRKTNSSGDTDGAWKTAVTGKYKITLDTAALTVTFTPIPEVTKITVSGHETVVSGHDYPYTATVTAYHGASQDVTWSRAGNNQPGTTISSAGVLTVDADETGSLTITATSTAEGFTNITSSVTVSVTTGVVYLIGDAIDLDGTPEWPATPGTAADKAMTKEAEGKWTWTGMMRGNKTFKFHDNTVNNTAENSWNTGTWYVAEGIDVSTAGTEPKTVKKTASSDGGGAWKTAVTGKYKITLDTAALTVTFTPIPEVTGITVSGPETVVPGGPDYTYTVTVTVYHEASKTVTWTLTGNNQSGTTISSVGVLTVAAGETGPLTITATSTLDGTVKGSKTVNVGFGDIYLIGTDFGGWPEPPVATSGQKMTKGSNGSYTWTGTMKRGSGFKFHDDTITGYEDGYWFNAPSNDKATTNDTHSVSITVGSDSGKDWETSHGGQYTVTLNTAASTVTFVSTPQIVTITNPVAGLAPGEENTFGITVTSGDGAAVTWTVTGGGIGSGTGTGTAITTGGVLTLGSGEWITHTLTITATTALNETASTTVGVIDAKVWLVGAMNGWNNAPGTEMDRNRPEALFTWTGSINGGDQFKFAVSDNSDYSESEDKWKRIWLIPPDRNENDKLFWIKNLSDTFSVYRYGSAGSDNQCGWYFAKDSDGEGGPGNGTYTLTYNAVTKTLTVTAVAEQP